MIDSLPRAGELFWSYKPVWREGVIFVCLRKSTCGEWVEAIEARPDQTGFSVHPYPARYM